MEWFLIGIPVALAVYLAVTWQLKPDVVGKALGLFLLLMLVCAAVIPVFSAMLHDVMAANHQTSRYGRGALVYADEHGKLPPKNWRPAYVKENPVHLFRKDVSAWPAMNPDLAGKPIPKTARPNTILYAFALSGEWNSLITLEKDRVSLFYVDGRNEYAALDRDGYIVTGPQNEPIKVRRMVGENRYRKASIWALLWVGVAVTYNLIRAWVSRDSQRRRIAIFNMAVCILPAICAIAMFRNSARFN